MNHLHRKNHFTNIKITTFNCLMVILLFVITSVPALGQQTTNDQTMARMANIHLIAHTSSDSVVLRWAPSTAGGWSIANNLGYWVERIEIAENVEINDANYIKLNALPLKPMSLEEWKAYAGPDNHLSAIAAQAIYGESFIPEPLNENGVSALKNAADELSNRYSFSLFTADNDAVTATAMGLRYVDRDVQNGNQYAYRIFVAEQTTEYAFDTAYVFVQVKNMPQAPAPVDLSFESGDGRIKLSWNENTIQPYSGYYIYRSNDEGNTFTKMNKVPMVIVSGNSSNNVEPYYNDTLTINYKMYQYQVFGVTPFGELSLPAEITAYSKDLLPPPSPKINKPEQISSTQIK
nr:hypothetical protein [Prolixibacteraceae bacterium]